MVLYYAFHELHILPHQWLLLPDWEKAIIYAFVDERAKELARQAAKAKRG